MPISHRQLGSGPPLLLINGYAASAMDWDPTFLDALAAKSQVVCPDPRGIANSPPLPQGHELSVESMASDLLELADAEGLESFDLAGWSMGGFVAQQVAATASDRVRRLVLLSTDCGGPDAVPADPETWARPIDHSGTPREQASRLLALLFPPDLAPKIDAEFGDLVAEARAALRPETLDAQADAIATWHAGPASERLARVTMPALVAAGTEDVVIPFDNSPHLASSLPEGHLEPFEGGGHAFMAQEPERLAAAINAWIGR